MPPVATSLLLRLRGLSLFLRRCALGLFRRLRALSLRMQVACVAAIVLVAVGGWLLLRDSALFSVNQVTIEGLSADAVPAVSEQLDAAARSQTTTDFSVGAVRAAVAADSLITGVRAITHAPHGVTLYVGERMPLARIHVDGQLIPVAADGTVVTGLRAAAHLPTVRSALLPFGGHASDPFVLDALRVLAAAPKPLRARVATVSRASGALTVYLHHGPRLIFGDGALPHAKWDAAAAVLASRRSRGATYIDLVLPWRPAAQVGDPATSLTAAGASPPPLGTAAALSPAVLQLSSST